MATKDDNRILYEMTPEALHQKAVELKENIGGMFTVKSKRTGKDYTFKIHRSFYRDKWYTWVYVERQYLQMLKLGFYGNGDIIKDGKAVEGEPAKAIGWLLKLIYAEKFEVVKQSVELYHLGKCLSCGKKLTDSISIETGYGSVCRGKQK